MSDIDMERIEKVIHEVAHKVATQIHMTKTEEIVQRQLKSIGINVDDPHNSILIERMADKAAEHAAKHVFAIFGVDIDKPKDVEEFRVALRFAAELQRNIGRGKAAAFVTIGGLLATAVWVAVATKMGWVK